MKIIQIQLLLIAILFSSCKNEREIQVDTDTDFIEVTEQQFQMGGMSAGTLQHIEITKTVHISGKIVSKAGGIARITLPVEGIIMDVLAAPGQMLRKGDNLFTVGGYEIIELQKEFVISSARIDLLKAEFERAGTLFQEGINTEKEFLTARSSYFSELAVYNALELKLQQVGLNTSAIKKGNFSTVYTIRSPFTGQLNRLEVVKGQFVQPENELAEIVSTKNKELELALFENDVLHVSKGQEVIFQVLGRDDSFTARVTRVGSGLDSGSGTIRCYAEIEPDDLDVLYVNQMLSGEIIIHSDSVMAIPNEALISEANANYVILILEKNEGVYRMEKIEVKTGRSDQNYTELIGFEEGKKILFSGVEYLATE